MPVRLVRFDEDLRVRAELNQESIRVAGEQLLLAINHASTNDPAISDKLLPLREYAEAGIAGSVKSPRTWAMEPLRYEFKEDLLPIELLEAYGRFAFHTHGLTKTPPAVQYRNGKAYISVDD